jgi:hypothetical protein
MFSLLTHNTGNKNKRQKKTDSGITITDPYYCFNLLHWTAGNYHSAVWLSIFPSQYELVDNESSVTDTVIKTLM